MDKLKILPNWEEKEKEWDELSTKAQNIKKLKSLSRLPKMPGITKGTSRFLKGKSLFYQIKYDKNKIFLKYFFKKPFTYSVALLKSYFQKNSFERREDFFFYGIKDEEAFKASISKEDALVLVGFSYCHKPFECPSGRFTSACKNDEKSPVCSQCFIGKCSSLLKGSKAEIHYIPTIHYIGEAIFKAVHENPKKKVYFLITACEMSLVMFSDWGNMIRAKGIGVRLDGRICNTMRAFKLSEEGIKPGLTVVLDKTKEKILNILSAV